MKQAETRGKSKFAKEYRGDPSIHQLNLVWQKEIEDTPKTYRQSTNKTQPINLQIRIKIDDEKHLRPVTTLSAMP